MQARHNFLNLIHGAEFDLDSTLFAALQRAEKNLGIAKSHHSSQLLNQVHAGLERERVDEMLTGGAE